MPTLRRRRARESVDILMEGGWDGGFVVVEIRDWGLGLAVVLVLIRR